MILDAQSLFSTAQNVFSAGTTVVSTNSVDLLRIAQDLGVGEPLYISMNVTTAFAGGTSIAFNLVTDDNGALSSPAIVAQLGSLTIAQLAVNTNWLFRFPIVQAVAMERYVGISYVSTGTSTAGAVTTALCRDGQRWNAYPSNYPTA